MADDIDMDIDHFIGDRVRAFREMKNVKRAELARRMDITPPHLLNLELGARSWTARMAESAARCLGVDLALLFPRLIQERPRPVRKPRQAAESAAS